MGRKDTTFGGGDGVVTVDFLAFDDMWGLNRMSDGRIVVAGYAEDAADTFDHVAVARFTSNGVLDHTFSGDGKVTTAIPGYSFTDAWRSVVQPNGKVVVVGEAEMTPGGDGDIFAVRYQENGTLDPAFSGDGIFTFDLGGDDGAWDVQLLGNGGTLLAGWSDAPSEGRIALVWLTSSGAIDHGEGGGDGKSVVDLVPDNSDEIARAVFVLSSGKLLVAGDADKAVGPGSPGDVIIARLNANGLRDNTFGGGDAVVGSDSNADESVFGARRKSNGKVVVAGFADFGFFVARLKPNGSRDSTFGANGFAKTFPPTSRANDVEILGSGKIVVAGSVNNDALTVRLLG